MKIWTLGDAVVDLLPLDNMHFEACVGGAPVNVAVGVARLGQHSGFIGRVGKDTFGNFLSESMQANGVNTDYIQFDEIHHTSTVLVSLNARGERQFNFLVKASADQFLTAELLPELGKDILHFCSLALVEPTCRNTLEHTIQKIRDAGGVLSFDINLREQMWGNALVMRKEIEEKASQADILKMSEEEWLWLIQHDDFTTALTCLEAYPARLKVVTCGARGALVLWQNQVFHFYGYRVESIDTTGAGDAFMAGLLHYIASEGWPRHVSELNTLMTQASACGALATTQKGALNAIPDRQQLIAFIAEHSALEVEEKK
ncbi:aminoimidazole riboside kinase [Kluyvera sp. STS39-E]|uniref:aminoimidazole riboside kinase n=1 Tax=Kluyvera sp. STS39-E TaxID=3234748 RepID=UPI0034C62146